jgi:hypothetical protein
MRDIGRSGDEWYDTERHQNIFKSGGGTLQVVEALSSDPRTTQKKKGNLGSFCKLGKIKVNLYSYLYMYKHIYVFIYIYIHINKRFRTTFIASIFQTNDTIFFILYFYYCCTGNTLWQWHYSYLNNYYSSKPPWSWNVLPFMLCACLFSDTALLVPQVQARSDIFSNSQSSDGKHFLCQTSSLGFGTNWYLTVVWQRLKPLWAISPMCKMAIMRIHTPQGCRDN